MDLKILKFACVLMGFNAFLIWGTILYIYITK